mmetsp:Transcript_8743/g.16081  ORF Transcript_8743/g.16081 Transcript_8743/m.16081 type:complete len:204 (-) Transcript_8743:156-767(-)
MPTEEGPEAAAAADVLLGGLLRPSFNAAFDSKTPIFPPTPISADPTVTAADAPRGGLFGPPLKAFFESKTPTAPSERYSVDSCHGTEAPSVSGDFIFPTPFAAALPDEAPAWLAPVFALARPTCPAVAAAVSEKVCVFVSITPTPVLRKTSSIDADVAESRATTKVSRLRASPGSPASISLVEDSRPPGCGESAATAGGTLDD